MFGSRKRDDDDDDDDKVVKGLSVDESGSPYNYIAIIDAGSTGSRLHIFNWVNKKGGVAGDSKDTKNAQERDSASDSDSDDDSDNSTNDKNRNKQKGAKGGADLNLLKMLDVRQDPSWYKKVDGGIDSFAEDPKKVGKKHLKKLLKHAKKIIPADQLERTPIYVHATGGMRRLSKQDQMGIIDSTCAYISEKSSFWLPDCKTHVRVIQGGEEGLYGWIAANYLVGSLDDPSSHDHGKDHATYGILDMGGASMEVAFEPVKSKASANFGDEASEYTLHLEGNYDIHTQSFQGYGVRMAHFAYLQVLAGQAAKEGDKNVKLDDPCAPKGHKRELELPDGTKMELTGSGLVEVCEKYLKVLAKDQCKSQENQEDKDTKDKDSRQTDLDAEEPPRGCLLDSAPLTNLDVHHFIGVSKYHDIITSPALGLDDGSKYDHAKFKEAVNEFCEDDWEDLISEHHDISEKHLGNLCFRGKWLDAVLEDGFGFVGNATSEEEEVKGDKSSDEDAKAVKGSKSSSKNTSKGSNKGYKSSDKSKGEDEDEDVDEEEDDDEEERKEDDDGDESSNLNDSADSLIVQRDTITYLDPFQSADIIQGRQYSWALGRAVLYASAESQEMNIVGYEYKHESKPGKVEINGAEQNADWKRPVFKRDSEPANNGTDESNWHDIVESHGGDRVWGSVAFLFILAIAVYLLLGKSRRDLILRSIMSRFWKSKPSRNTSRQPYRPIDEDIELGDVETEFEIHSDDERLRN